MMYPFMTLDDNTEIVHSEMQPDHRVKVYIEKPDEKDCFHSAVCYLPDYTWEDVSGFTPAEIDRYQKFQMCIRDSACPDDAAILCHGILKRKGAVGFQQLPQRAHIQRSQCTCLLYTSAVRGQSPGQPGQRPERAIHRSLRLADGLR